MLLGYNVAKASTSPRNSTWFTRPFLLVRGWGLGTKLHTHTPVIQAGNHIQVLHKLAVGLALSVHCCSALRDRVVCLLTLLQVLHLTQQCHQLQHVEQQLSLMQLLKEGAATVTSSCNKSLLTPAMWFLSTYMLESKSSTTERYIHHVRK